MPSDDLRFVAVWGRWFEWSGVVWEPDDTLAAYDLVRHECRTAAAELTKRDKSDKAMRQAAAVACAKTVASVEKLAKSGAKLYG